MNLISHGIVKENIEINVSEFQFLNFRKKMILFYLFSFAICHTLAKSSQWSFNPDCPTEDAARNCEDVCITANAKCIPDCDGDQECIRQCSRDYALCVEACPCYSECYGGCPCPNETEYCQSCETQYQKEHNVCRDIGGYHIRLHHLVIG